MINNITGSPVEGENFFGREKELDFAWNHIQKGNSIILSAPRRVGKSSFAKKLIESAKEKGWNTLEINLEEIKSEEGFIKLFIEKLQVESWWQKALTKTENLLGQILEGIKTNIEYNGIKASFEWKAKKTDIYNNLKNLLNHKEETLIMMDEMAIHRC
ncbi:MAG: ATP-binding protein [Bacteroidetes bacterium]|nr:ATP-binding protein [Bacteroidota bacterium]